MRLRVFDILLLIVLAVGGVFVWKTGQERSRLTARYNRLAGITGDLNVTDPTKVYIQALETDDPMHFAWRIYRPPNYQQVMHSNVFSTGSSSSGSSESIGRVRFRANGRGDLELYTRLTSDSAGGSIVSGPFVKLLDDHWKELDIEQLGRNGPTIIAPEQTVTLVRITLPDDLQAKAVKSLGQPIPKHIVPVLYELKLGPDAAKP